MADTRVKALAERILERAQELGALQFGEFVLASGAKSAYYFDGRRLSLDPEGADLVSAAFLSLARAAGARGAGGPTVAAVPIAGAVTLRSRLEGEPTLTGFFVRDRPKEHGTGQQVEGPLERGTPVAVFDDTVSTGGSLFNVIDAVEAHGCEVVIVLAVLDRHQGGSEELRRRGVRFRALLEADSEGNVTVVDDA